MVDRKALIGALQAAGANPDFKADRTGLHISSKVIRCVDFQGVPSVFLASGDDDAMRNAVVDGVHWGLHLSVQPGGAAVCVCVPADTSDKVAHALATLAGASAAVRVDLVFYDIVSGCVVRSSRTAVLPCFASLRRTEDWAEQLSFRQTNVPAVGAALAGMLTRRVPAFRWYRNVTSGFWSGRVGGWQVCTLSDAGGEIRFGQTDKERSATPPVGMDGLPALASWVEAFAAKRSDRNSYEGSRKHEHLLESAVWRGPSVVAVTVPGAMLPLEPVVPVSKPPLQVPALYSTASEASARFVDAVMKDSTTPWVVELKVDSGGQGQYYRHAITQAVLYREFFRHATDMHGWFRDLGLEPTDFQGAVVFPRLKGTVEHRNQLLKQLRKTADCFGVAVVELPWNWDTLHTRCVH